METIVMRDFSAGWCPSDNPANSPRKNGLQRLDNLHLTKNGSVSLAAAKTQVSTLNANAHSIFVNSGVFDTVYTGRINQKVYRDGTQIIDFGSGNHTAFGSGYGYVLIADGQQRKKDNGVTTSDLGVGIYNSALNVEVVQTGLGTTLVGDYQWVMVVVERNGAYEAYSKATPISLTATLTIGKGVYLRHPNPRLFNSSATHAWIYRRGGEILDQFYRVAEINLDTWGTTGEITFFDYGGATSLTDKLALEQNKRINVFLNSVAFPDTLGTIYEILGPINGRHFYFTDSEILVSLINNPATYDLRSVIKFSGEASEKFLWARKAGENGILVATTKDIYLLTGTFVTLPDGFVDAYLRGLSITNLPITRDATTFDGKVIYLAQSGWRMLSAGAGEARSLIDDRLDVLYDPALENTTGYSTIQYSVALRYPCAVVKDKLYCSIPLLNRVEVLDLVRNYWSVRTGHVDLFFPSTRENLFYVDNTTLAYGFYEHQNPNSPVPVDFQTVFFDNNQPNNRKDASTLIVKANTGGTGLTLHLYTDDNLASPTKVATISGTQMAQPNLINLEGLIARSFCVRILGNATDVEITSITIDYEPRPAPITHFRSGIINFGTAGRKRIPSHPLMVDTFDSSITAKIYIDGVLRRDTFIATNGRRRTWNLQLLNDFPGVDFEYEFSGNAGFEFYGLMQPEFIEKFPTPLVYYRSPKFNMGISNNKRVVTWPIILDKRNANVIVRAFADGVQLIEQLIVEPDKKTHFIHQSMFGREFELELVTQDTGAFELWDIGKPEVVEIFPLERRFDSYGTTEIFKYGKIKELEVRIMSQGDILIPIKVIFSNNDSFQGFIEVMPGIQDTYRVMFPKTYGGTIVRVEIGIAEFPFYIWGIRAKAARSGTDTSLEWVSLERLNGQA